MDSLDNLKIPDKSKIRKNPYYESLVKQGFSIVVHYSPENVADIMSGKQRFDFDLLEHDPDELEAFAYYNANSIAASH